MINQRNKETLIILIQGNRETLNALEEIDFSITHLIDYVNISTSKPIALRKAKIVCNFGLSECNRLKDNDMNRNI